MNPFESVREYETFVYTLPQQRPNILHSTLILARRGRLLAELTGEITLSDGHRLVVYERLSWSVGPLIIEGYSYEVWHGSDKLYWYD